MAGRFKGAIGAALAVAMAIGAGTGPVASQAPATPEAATPAPSAPPAATSPSPPAPAAPSAAPAQPAVPPAPATSQPPVLTDMPPRQAPSTFKDYPTLVAPSANPADMDEVVVPAKPALAQEGRTTWDNGFTTLMQTFRRIHQQAVDSGLKPAGRPIARFLETNDEGFRFQALLPVEAPASPPALPGGFSMAQTPDGPKLRFVHKAPYEEIDSTYEAITAYLDAKNITVEDSFVEEYVTDLTDPADPELEINIFVTRKN